MLNENWVKQKIEYLTSKILNLEKGGGGGGSGSSVSWKQITTSGTHIADIKIDGRTTEVYAPTSGGGGSANDGKLTIQKNGTTVQTFTANQSTNVTANITVPTKVSELTEDTTHRTVTDTEKQNWNNKLSSETDPTVPSWAKQTNKPTYKWSEIQEKPFVSVGNEFEVTDNVVNLKEPYYSKAEIDKMIGDVDKILINAMDGVI